MRRTLARVLLCLALPLCAVGPALLPGRVFAPLDAAACEPLAGEDPLAAQAALAGANLLAVDALVPIASDRTLLRERLLEGELPLWDQHLGLGLPLIGNTLAAPFYPPNLILLPLPERRAGAVRALLALLLAGLGLWLLLERLGLSFAAGAVGALALQAGGFGLANLPLAPKIDAALWLPWMLWGVEGWLDGQRGSAWALGLASAASFLAGFPPIALFGLCATGVYGLVRARALHVSATRALGALLLCLCGLGLAAPQLALTLDASRQSERGRQSAARLEAQALPLETSFTLIAPQLFGSPLETLDAARDPLTWWLLDADDAERAQQANALEWDLWIGLGALALAAAALCALPRRALFPALLGVFAVGFAQGWPLIRLLYHVPGLDLGAPARAAALLWVSAAWLCGMGAEALLQRAPRALAAFAVTVGLSFVGALWFVADFEPQAWIVALPAQLATRFNVDAGRVAATVDLAVLPHSAARLARSATDVLSAGLLLSIALACLLRIPSRAWRAAALLIAVCLPGLMRGWSYLVPRRIAPTAAQWPASEAMDALAEAAGDGRVLRFDESASGVGDVLALARPNLPQVYGVGDLTPYVAFPARRTVELLAALDPASRYRSGISRLSDVAHLDHPILDHLRVTAVLARHPLQHARLESVYEREGFHIYRRRGVPPVARVVPTAIVADDDSAGLARLLANDFDGVTTCLLEPGCEIADATRPDAWHAGSLTVARPRAERLEIEVRDSSGGWLVVSEAWAPGWEAHIDGESVEMLRADHALRAVQLPAGDHEVVMVYAPTAWTLGLAAALLALLLTVLIARLGAPRV